MTDKTQSIFSIRFVALNIVILLCFGNMAAFCDFYLYLGTLNIPEETFGLLLGVFNLTALFLRPLVSMFLHRRNALLWMLIGIIVQSAALFAYHSALSFELLLIVRICHGVAYVTLLAACMTILVDIIPEGQSAHAFSMVSVVTLIPFVVVPPFINGISGLLRGYTNLLAGFGVLALAGVPALIVLNRGQAGGERDSESAPLRWLDMKENIRNYPVLIGLLATFFFYCIYAMVLYYINGYAVEKGFDHKGLYITVASISMIVIRLSLGRFFDRLGRIRLTGLGMLVMIVCCLALLTVSSMRAFLLIAAFTGISWGMTVPLLSAIVCDLSRPRFRAFNVNLSSEVTDGGFFAGPAIGGLILATDNGYRTLFLLCILLAIAVLACLPFAKESIVDDTEVDLS